MSKIRTLIVDDEPLARSGVRLLLRRHEDVEVVGECGDGYEAVEAIQDLQPELLFLDVQMPGLDGFGVLEAVGSERVPAVVFVTAYDQYALRAFRVHAVDYLLKPVEKKPFQEALDRARSRIAGGRDDEVRRRLVALLQEYRPAPEEPLGGPATPGRFLQRLMVKEHGRVFFLKTEAIDWFEAADNYIRIHTGGKTHLIRGTMTELEQRLDPERFVRIHRRTIVNLERIRVIHPYFKGEYMVVLTTGAELKLSRGYRDRVLVDGM
jgi:two-component system LytT family response regulator